MFVNKLLSCQQNILHSRRLIINVIATFQHLIKYSCSAMDFYGATMTLANFAFLSILELLITTMAYTVECRLLFGEVISRNKKLNLFF